MLSSDDSGENDHMNARSAAHETNHVARLPHAARPGLDDRGRRWAALLDRIAAGDVGALAALYDETSPLLFGLVMYILQDRAAAEDTLVDVYLKVPDYAGSPRREQNPVPWLIGLARQTALARLDRGRRSGRTVQRPPLPVAPAASVVPFEPLDSERRQVRRALTQLTPRERSIIQMTYFEGLGAGAVADELSVPITQVTNDIQQAMWKLRTSLREVETD